VLTHRYDLSRRGSVSIAIRVPRELAQQLREAAVASGIDVSTYMRDALFAAPNITRAAVNEIQWGAAAAERALAESQMQSLRDQVARALADSATAREQLVTLERDLAQRPLRLLFLSGRVLRGETGARQEFAEVWGHLDPPAQEQLLPAMIMALREFLLAVPEAKPSSDDLARQRRVVADVDWLLSYLADALGGSASHGPEPSVWGTPSLTLVGHPKQRTARPWSCERPHPSPEIDVVVPCEDHSRRVFGVGRIEIGMPFWCAVTRLEHTEWLIANGRDSEAGSMLADATHTFERLHARPWLDRSMKSAPAAVVASWRAGRRTNEPLPQRVHARPRDIGRGPAA
jgi:hypothetical protein